MKTPILLTIGGALLFLGGANSAALSSTSASPWSGLQILTPFDHLENDRDIKVGSPPPTTLIKKTIVAIPSGASPSPRPPPVNTTASLPLLFVRVADKTQTQTAQSTQKETPAEESAMAACSKDIDKIFGPKATGAAGKKDRLDISEQDKKRMKNIVNGCGSRLHAVKEEEAKKEKVTATTKTKEAGGEETGV